MEVIAWPRDFPEFKRLDNLMRCGICYEYMKTSMMTSCSHNYCSLCIRKYMQYKTMCPTCFEETYEANLRNNRPLDDIILVYTSIRDKLFRHLRLATVHIIQPMPGEEEKPKTSQNANPVSNDASVKPGLKNASVTPGLKNVSVTPGLKKGDLSSSMRSGSGKANTIVRKLDESAGRDELEEGIFTLKSPTTPKPSEVASPTTSHAVTSVTKIPAIFCSPKKSSVLMAASPTILKTVPCPVCNVDIPERGINGHLDSCLVRDKSPIKKPSDNARRRSPVPKRVYSMMSEKELRKWLKTYGLNTTGDKRTLTNRLQRYTVIYNSECDSDDPRPVSEIIRQVESEEKATATASTSSILKSHITRKTEPKIIEEENKKYLEKNKENFESLIKAMQERNGANIRPTGHFMANRIESDESDMEEDDSYFFKATMSAAETHAPAGGYGCSKAAAWPDDKARCKPKDEPDDVFEVSDDSQPAPFCPSPDLSKVGGRKVAPPAINGDVDCDSDSDESISLLANCEVLLQENGYQCDKTEIGDETEIDPDFLMAVDNRVTESQIVDPDFIVTESELIAAGSDNSEDGFVSPVQPKRRRRLAADSRQTKRDESPDLLEKNPSPSGRKSLQPPATESRTEDLDFLATDDSEVTTADNSGDEFTPVRRNVRLSNPSADHSDSKSSTKRKRPDQKTGSRATDLDVAIDDAPELKTPSRQMKKQKNTPEGCEPPKRVLRQRTK